jgi:hypothetical protein
MKLFNTIQKADKNEQSLGEYFVTKRDEHLKEMRAAKWISAAISAGEALVAGTVLGIGVTSILNDESELTAQQKFVTAVASGTCAMLLIDKSVNNVKLAYSKHTHMKAFKTRTDNILKNIKVLVETINSNDSVEAMSNPESETKSSCNPKATASANLKELEADKKEELQ